MKSAFVGRIDMPDITRNPEIVQPEPNPAREMPKKPDPSVQPEKQRDT